MIDEILSIAKSLAQEPEDSTICTDIRGGELFRTACFELENQVGSVASSRNEYSFKEGTEDLFLSLDNILLSGNLKKSDLASPGSLILNPFEVSNHLALVRVQCNVGNFDIDQIEIDISADNQTSWLTDQGKIIAPNKYLFVDTIVFETLTIKIILPADVNIEVYDMFVERFSIDLSKGKKRNFHFLIASYILQDKAIRALQNGHEHQHNSYAKTARDFRKMVLGENTDDPKGDVGSLISHYPGNKDKDRYYQPSSLDEILEDGNIIGFSTDGTIRRVN